MAQFIASGQTVGGCELVEQVVEERSVFFDEGALGLEVGLGLMARLGGFALAQRSRDAFGRHPSAFVFSIHALVDLAAIEVSEHRALERVELGDCFVLKCVGRGPKQSKDLHL